MKSPTRKSKSDSVIEAVLADAENVFSKKSTFTAPEGDTVLRILPGIDSPIFYSRGLYHQTSTDRVAEITGLPRIEGAKYSLMCLKAFEEPCPVDQYMDRLYEKGSSRERRLADALTPNIRVFVNIGFPTRPRETVQILAIPKAIFGRLIEFMKGKPQAGMPGVDFTDDDTGRDMVLTRAGKGLRTKWEITMTPNPAPLANRAWLTQRHDLEAFVRKGLLSYEETLDALVKSQAMLVGFNPQFGMDEPEPEGQEDADTESENQEETSPRTTGRIPKRRKA